MSDKNSSFINLPDLPASIDNAVKNLTDKPTQGIGQTLADVWYLVFGGITHAADKRRMKYAHDLKLYEQELSQAILSLRKLFVNLISKSMDSHYTSNVHPSFAEIIKQMSPIDARILKTLHPKYNFPVVDYVLENHLTSSYELQFPAVYISSLSDIDMWSASSAISSLERLGIIALDTSSSFSDKSVYTPFEETDYYKTFSSKAIRSYASKRATIHKYLGFFTPLGKNFFEVCVK